MRDASAPRQKLVLISAWLPLGVSEAIVAPSKKSRRVVPSYCAPVVCHAPSQTSETVMPEFAKVQTRSLPNQLLRRLVLKKRMVLIESAEAEPHA